MWLSMPQSMTEMWCWWDLTSHPPASTQILHDIMQLVVQMDSNLVFVLGDFNMVPHADRDRLSASGRDSLDLRHCADTFALTDV